MIALKDVSFSRGPLAVLKQVSLEVAAGEVLCVLGPNGAGKTTLLNCILGVELGWTGAIALGGEDIRGLSRMKAAQRVAYVPQAGAAAFSFSVAQCVMMGRTPHIPLGGEPGAADHEAVAAALEQAGVPHLAERRYDELSGGERQLVLIARAVAQDTPAILLDEPTAGLDLANQARALRIVQALARRGRAILMTTHSPEQAFLLGCGAVLMKAGEVLAAGPADTVCTEARLQALYDVPLRLLRGSAGDDGAFTACVLRL